MAINFCPIASGSSGNCILIFSKHTRALIDAGLSGAQIERGLKKAGVSPFDLDAIFITHDHFDHAKGAGVLSRRYNIPIFATQGSWDKMEGQLGKISPFNRKIIYSGEHFFLNDFTVMPFPIPHDAGDPVGFSIYAENKKICVATDIGYPSQEVKEEISGCDILLLEANHDVQMLKNGSYPWHLKKRILSDSGHLSNEAAGTMLIEAISCKLKYLFLGHLSSENNEPELAYNTVAQILTKHKMPLNKAFNMHVANRHNVTGVFEV